MLSSLLVLPCYKVRTKYGKRRNVEFQLMKCDVSQIGKNETDKIIPLMQADEQKKCQFSKSPDSVKGTLVSRLLVKNALKKNKRIQDVVFGVTRALKPIWCEYNCSKHPCLNFSISHSGNWVICGILSHAVLGLDVQEISIGKEKCLKNFLFNMRKSFSFREWKVINCNYFKDQFDENDVLSCYNKMFKFWESLKDDFFKLNMIKKRFFLYWVLKESFLKINKYFCWGG